MQKLKIICRLLLVFGVACNLFFSCSSRYSQAKEIKILLPDSLHIKDYLVVSSTKKYNHTLSLFDHYTRNLIVIDIENERVQKVVRLPYPQFTKKYWLGEVNDSAVIGMNTSHTNTENHLDSIYHTFDGHKNQFFTPFFKDSAAFRILNGSLYLSPAFGCQGYCNGKWLLLPFVHKQNQAPWVVLPVNLDENSISTFLDRKFISSDPTERTEWSYAATPSIYAEWMDENRVIIGSKYSAWVYFWDVRTSAPFDSCRIAAPDISLVDFVTGPGYFAKPGEHSVSGGRASYGQIFYDKNTGNIYREVYYKPIPGKWNSYYQNSYGLLQYSIAQHSVTRQIQDTSMLYVYTVHDDIVYGVDMANISINPKVIRIISLPTATLRERDTVFTHSFLPIEESFSAYIDKIGMAGIENVIYIEMGRMCPCNWTKVIQKCAIIDSCFSDAEIGFIFQYSQNAFMPGLFNKNLKEVKFLCFADSLNIQEEYIPIFDQPVLFTRKQNQKLSIYPLGSMNAEEISKLLMRLREE